MKLRVHPAAELFPMLPDEELEALAEDIKANGLVHPIVIWDAGGEWLLLDGRNRKRASEIAGVNPATKPWHGKDPVAFIISANLHRRHLNPSQRSLIADDLAKLRQGRQAKSQICDFATTQADAAKLLHVSKRTVESARKVKERGTPELVEAVRSGEVAVSAAAEVAKLPVEQQREIVAKGKRAVAERAKAIRESIDDYDPGDDDDDADIVIADVDDAPIAPDPDRPRKWGDFELTRAVASLVGRCRDFRSDVDRIFRDVDPDRMPEFAERAESALLEVFESIRDRLPVTARRATENRARMRVLDGGKG